MISFLTLGGAALEYRTDFSEADYGNIFFLDRSEENVLFHLSLRRQTGLAVCNRRTGEDWAKEVRKTIDLTGAHHDVMIRFTPPRIEVMLNGETLFDFATEFPNLGEIAGIDYNGAILGDELIISGAANENRLQQYDIALEPGFAIAGWAFDPGSRKQRFILEVPGLEARLPVMSEPMLDLEDGMPTQVPTERIAAFRATLPGRVWRAVAEGVDEVMLHLRYNEYHANPFALSRRAVAALIEAMAEDDEMDLVGEGIEAVLLAIEHVRYGRLMPLLTPEAQGFIVRAARRFGVSEFLFEGMAAADLEIQDGGLDAGIDPDQVLITRLRTELTNRWEEGARQRPGQVLGDLLRRYPISAKARRGLFLSLSELFCSRDMFLDLYALFAGDGSTELTITEEPWLNSAALPFLYMQQRYDDILLVLQQLRNARQGWIASSPVAWVIRQMVREPVHHVDGNTQLDILRAYFAFVDSQSGSYWGRTQCRQMIRAAIAIIQNMDLLPEELRGDIIGFAIRNHGLSRAFWEDFEADVLPLGAQVAAELVAAKDAFAQVQGLIGAREAGPQSAFDLFEHYGTHDLDKTRFEIFASWQSDMAMPKAITLLSSEARPGSRGESALRLLAAPGAPEPRDHQVGTVRAAIRACYDKLPKAPHYRLTREMGGAAVDLLARLGRMSEEALREEVSDLLPRLTPLAGQRNGFIGIAIELALINGFVRSDRADQGWVLLGHAGQLINELSEAAHEAFTTAPAVLSALYGLRRSARDTASPLAKAALRICEAAVPALPEAITGRDDCEVANPLFDTVVTVFSCRPNLDSRIPAMRATWLARLKALGVPYIVVVGNGDGRREGDVVHLDAPDDYEGLPQKTLATVDWVYENTPYSYMLKIDDDCALDPEEFFHTLSYRKFDYYGRLLRRHIGQMRRDWHCGKSSSERGRLELDKSPEPSTYADGGSGYSLSRRAMHVIRQQRTTPEGKRLMANSFMEDKLIGDLLDMGDVRLSEEDYYVAIQRRSGAKTQPVSIWVNSFFASRSTPVKLTHLDSVEPQKKALKLMDSAALFPRKVWPSYDAPKLVYESNTLELISREDKLARLNGEDLAVVACMRNEMFMLPHFLEHYRRLGIKAFLIADNCSDDGTLEYLDEQPDVALFSADTSYGKSHYGVAWQQALLSNFRVGRWSLVADADELIVYPGWQKKPLAAMLEGSDMAGAEAVRLFMLDMYPKGPLSAVDFKSGDPFAEAGYVDKEPFLTNWPGTGPFSNMATWTSAVRHRLLRNSRPELFVAQKIALMKYQPWMRLSAGLHYVADVKLAKKEMLFAHFKYHGEFRRKAQAEVLRKQHFNGAEEYERYLALLSEGREEIYDPKISVAWQKAPFVKKLMGRWL